MDTKCNLGSVVVEVYVHDFCRKQEKFIWTSPTKIPIHTTYMILKENLNVICLYSLPCKWKTLHCTLSLMNEICFVHFITCIFCPICFAFIFYYLAAPAFIQNTKYIFYLFPPVFFSKISNNIFTKIYTEPPHFICLDDIIALFVNRLTPLRLTIQDHILLSLALNKHSTTVANARPSCVFCITANIASLAYTNVSLFSISRHLASSLAVRFFGLSS